MLVSHLMRDVIAAVIWLGAAAVLARLLVDILLGA
jgi:hypothetical protein